jgi:hypothetical protein
MTSQLFSPYSTESQYPIKKKESLRDMPKRFEDAQEDQESHKNTSPQSSGHRDFALSKEAQERMRQVTSGRDSSPSRSIQTREAISEGVALVVTDYSNRQLGDFLWHNRHPPEVTKMLTLAFEKVEINISSVAASRDVIQALRREHNKVITAEQLNSIRKELELKLDTTSPNPKVAELIQKWIQGLKFAWAAELIDSGLAAQEKLYQEQEVSSTRWSQGIILAGSVSEPILTPKSTSGGIEPYTVDYSHVSRPLSWELERTYMDATVATLSHLDEKLESLRGSGYKNIEVYIISELGQSDGNDYRIKQFAKKWQEEGLYEKLVIKSLYRKKPSSTNIVLYNKGKYQGHDGRKEEATMIATLRSKTIYEEIYALQGLSSHKNFNGVSETVFWPSTHLEGNVTKTDRTTPKEENGKRQTDYSGAKLVDSLKQVPPKGVTRITHILSSALISANIVQENITSYERARRQFSLGAKKDITPEQFDTVRRELHRALNDVRGESHQKKPSSDNKLGVSSEVTELATIEDRIQKWLQGTKFAMFSEMLEIEHARLQQAAMQKGDSVSSSWAMISVDGSPEFVQTDTTSPGEVGRYRSTDYASVSKLSGLPEAEFKRSHSDAEVATMGNVEKKLVYLLENRKGGKPYKAIEINILSVMGACDGCDYMIKQFAQKWQNKGLCEKLIMKFYYKAPPTEQTKYTGRSNYTTHYGRTKESAEIETIRRKNDIIYEEIYAPRDLSPKDYRSISGNIDLWPTGENEKGDSASSSLKTVIRHGDVAFIKQPLDAGIEDKVPDYIQEGALEFLERKDEKPSGEFAREAIDILNGKGGMFTEEADQLAKIIISKAKSSDKRTRTSIEQAILLRTKKKGYKQYIEAYVQCLTRKRNNSETLWEQYASEWLDNGGQFPQTIKDMFQQVGRWPKRYTDEIKQMIFKKFESIQPNKQKKIFECIGQKMSEDKEKRNSHLRNYIEQSIKDITRD